MTGVADEITVPADFQRDRVHWYWSAVPVPATQLWVLLILVSLLILPYGFFHAYFHDGAPQEGEFRSASLKLMIVAGTYFVFWGVHLYAMAKRPRPLGEWKWLEELALNPLIRFRIAKQGVMKVRGDLSPDNQLLAAAGEPIAGLIFVFPLLLPFLMFNKSFGIFVATQCGICVVVSLGAFLAYVHHPVEEVQISNLGVMVVIPQNICLCPWEVIEQIVWKEPRWSSLQMDLHFKPAGTEKLDIREIPLKSISDQKRDEVLRVISEHVPVKRIWGKEKAE